VVVIKNKRQEALRKTVEDIYAMPNLVGREVSSSIPLDALVLMDFFTSNLETLSTQL
jgi:hypothetical protein